MCDIYADLQMYVSSLVYVDCGVEIRWWWYLDCLYFTSLQTSFFTLPLLLTPSSIWLFSFSPLFSQSIFTLKTGNGFHNFTISSRSSLHLWYYRIKQIRLPSNESPNRKMPCFQHLCAGIWLRGKFPFPFFRLLILQNWIQHKSHL